MSTCNVHESFRKRSFKNQKVPYRIPVFFSQDLRNPTACWAAASEADNIGLNY